MDITKELTISQIWAAVSTVLLALLLFSKFFKDVLGIEAFGKKIYKGAPLVWKYIMRRAIFRKDMELKMDRMGKAVEEMNKQMQYNGGTSLMDAVRRIENMQAGQNLQLQDLARNLSYTVARMDINELCSERMCFRVNNEGACISINDAFLKQFGYIESDITGFSFENTIHEDDLPEARQKWQRAIDKCSRFYDEQRVYDKKGELYSVIVRAYPIVHDGKLKEFVGTIDITSKHEIKI